MPTPQLSPDLAKEAHEALERHGGLGAPGAAQAASDELGINRSTLRSRARKHQIDPGIQASMMAVGTHMVPKSVWMKTQPDSEGNSFSVQLVPKQDDVDRLELIREAFEGLPAAPAIIQSENSAAGKIAFFPQSDVHLGVEITSDRGGTDYSPDIAMERMRDGFSQTHGAIPACETAIILDNGDLTHANDDRDVTPRHEHRLKVSGSHRKNIQLSITAKAWQIDMALQRSERVIYRSNRGNHDPNTPDAVLPALQQRYRNEPRVTIDDSERETWIFQRGLVFIAAHHGHGIKAEKLAANIPPNFPVEFGASRFWYLITGHMHNPRQDTFGAFTWFQLPAMCAMDQHTADLGYTDTAAMRAMMFCERGGLKHDMTVRF